MISHTQAHIEILGGGNGVTFGIHRVESTGQWRSQHGGEKIFSRHLAIRAIPVNLWIRHARPELLKRQALNIFRSDDVMMASLDYVA